MKKRTFTKQMAGCLSLSALAMGMIAATQTAQAAGAFTAAGSFAQNVANSKHNLSNQRSGSGVNGGAAFGNNVGDIFTSGNSTNSHATAKVASDQICVFCHTPHGSNTAATATLPIWNRGLGIGGSGSTAGYKPYTMVGSNSSGSAAVGGMSLACLSCHDGTQAMDAMFNAPGSGPGAGTGLSAASQSGYVWSAGTGDVGGSFAQGGTTGANTVIHALSAAITWLGTDLSNDHPIGMQYCGGVSAGNCLDLDFKAPTKGGVGNKVGTNFTGNNTNSVGGVLKLFGGTATSAGTVECATCHDPHISDPGTALFLRVTPVASAICLTCHTK